jgi:protein phosphatase 1 regulatory subunit 37
MIRDYPDVVPTSISVPPSPPATSTSFFPPPSPASSVSNLSIASPPSTPTLSVQNPLFVRNSPAPPPRHPSASMQTTYTPYVPRARRGRDVPTNPLSPTGQHIPIITSSSQGGVTTRHPTPGGSSTASGDPYRHDAGPSAALLDKVRALDSLPRLGALKTLDLKGNDLRVSTMSRFLSFPTTKLFLFLFF